MARVPVPANDAEKPKIILHNEYIYNIYVTRLPPHDCLRTTMHWVNDTYVERASNVVDSPQNP